MLGITRRAGQKITVDHPAGTVTIRFKKPRNGKSTVVVDAPRSVRIKREG